MSKPASVKSTDSALDLHGTGRPSNLTTQQQQTLTEFRQVITEQHLLAENDSLGTDDATLLRFLRARRFNLQASLTMLKNCLAWRQNVVNGESLDQLYQEIDPFDFEHKEEIFKYWPMWFHSTDKIGRPLNIQLFGAFDVPKLYQAVDPDYHWKTVAVNCEALTREVIPGCRRTINDQVDSAYCIVDLKGFSLGQFWQLRSLAQKSFDVSQNYYPETMGHLAIVNAPSSFTYIWKVIKAWLAPETRRKIYVLGKDYQKELLQDVPAENLPEFLGGTCRCEGFQGGCSMSSRGPWLKDRTHPASLHGPKHEGESNGAVTESPGEQKAQAEQEKDRFVDAPKASTPAIEKARDDGELESRMEATQISSTS